MTIEEIKNQIEINEREQVMWAKRHGPDSYNASKYREFVNYWKNELTLKTKRRKRK